MPDYINYFPKPFLDDLVEGRCVPFVGAGFSRNANLPTGKQMPLWDDLGRALAEYFDDYEYAGAIEAISAFSDEFSKVKLVEKLHDLLLVEKAQPGNPHRAFCNLPFDLVVTTNVEFLLERGYEQVNRYCRPIIDEDHLSVETSGPEIKLLKLHGDLHHPRQLVMTEADYDAFLDRHPLVSTFLASLLIIKTAFFIGYSLDDPDFRQIWQIIGDRLGTLRRLAYTVLIGAPNHMIRRFERRGVKVVNLPGDQNEYATILTTVFEELRSHWSTGLITKSTTTDDESLAEMSLPSDATSRLCFFSVPSRLSSFYKSAVFPTAERHGFAPVMAVDVIAPGDNITAKVAALIDRAALMVIDLSSPTTQLEFHMALAKRAEHDWVLLIAEEDTKVPFDMKGIGHVIRPKNHELELEDFIGQLNIWFERIAEQLQPKFSQEPMRLLKKKEFRAAVISAMTLFESVLQKTLQEYDQPRPSHRYPIGRLVDHAARANLLDQESVALIRDWTAIRNKLVHMGGDVSARMAGQIVRGVQSMIERMRKKTPTTPLSQTGL